MVELDLSFVSLLALAFGLGCVAGFLLRGLRRRRIEDMLQFFRQRDQEQDRKIAILERDLSDARGRLLSLKADQGKGDKASGELRSAYDEAQRTIARLREELARPIASPTATPASPAPAPPAALPTAEPEPAVEDALAAELAAEAAPPAAKPAAASGAATPARPASGQSGSHKKNAKKGRLP